MGNTLVATETIFAKGVSLFQIEVNLSDDGLNHVEEVISLVFNRIGLLRRSGAIAWIYEELRKIDEINFRFMEKVDPVAAVIAYSSNLQRIPFRDILSWNLLWTEYKPDRIMEIIKMLSPKNMFYIVIARKYSGQEGNIHEPIFGTEMRIVNIEGETMKQFETALETENPALRLPLKNDYIASKFDLKPRETIKREHPRVIQDDAWCRIWFKQDDEYKRPVAVTRVALISPVVSKSPKALMLFKMFLACLQDALMEDISNADLAGVYCNISDEDFGLLLEVGGYDEKTTATC
ncbi:hypothetical protein COOONC_03508 [Cooperia oncophora]